MGCCCFFFFKVPGQSSSRVLNTGLFGSVSEGRLVKIVAGRLRDGPGLTLSCSGEGGRVSLTQEAHGADLEAESLVGVPEVVEHDVDDGQLVDARRVDLQH